MKLRKMSKMGIRYLFVKSMTVETILTFAYLIICFFVDSRWRLEIIFYSTIVFTVLSAILIMYPFVYYKTFGYHYDEQNIAIKKGVIIRRRNIIPCSQLLDVHLIQGPVMMLFKVCGIVLTTEKSSYYIPCLDRTEAEKLVAKIEQILLLSNTEKQQIYG